MDSHTSRMKTGSFKEMRGSGLPSLPIPVRSGKPEGRRVPFLSRKLLLKGLVIISILNLLLFINQLIQPAHADLHLKIHHHRAWQRQTSEKLQVFRVMDGEKQGNLMDRLDRHSAVDHQAVESSIEVMEAPRYNADSTKYDGSEQSTEGISMKMNLLTYCQIHGNVHKTLKSASLPNIPHLLDGQSDAYVFSCEKLPDEKFMASVGNGHVATVIDSDIILMNGLYNGAKGNSHRARIPSIVLSKILDIKPAVSDDTSHSSIQKRNYSLNVVNGMYTETIQGHDYLLRKNVYAHRQLKHLLVTEIDVIRFPEKNQTTLKLMLKNEVNKSNEDMDFFEGSCNIQESSCRYFYGRTKVAETNSSRLQEVHIFYDPIPDFLDIPPALASLKPFRQKWVFYASLSQDEDVAKKYYELALSYESSDILIQQHVESWHNLWNQGFIMLTGNLPLARVIFGGLYYILSSLQLDYVESDPYIGLSPSDLAHGVSDDDYLGHIFWDQETWMYPGVLMLHPDLGKLLLRTRLRTLTAARENAKTYGNKGAQYPWESARTGTEVTPGEIYGQNELHISGDISFAFQQYMYMTKDLDFYIVEGGRELVKNISEFWAHRVVYNKDDERYEIRDVMPPDEYHQSVNNSIYTNYVAKLALLADHNISSVLDITPNGMESWRDIAERMYLPFNSSELYHPEYEGYEKGTVVKQADTILIGFPLLMDMPEKVRRNDLTFYEEVTDPEGPAMTWTMYAIGWLELGEYKKAHNLIERNMKNVHEPFQVWSEIEGGGGAVNFITGVGGFLQSIIFGYGGFRIRSDCLEFNPTLPDKVTQLNFHGIGYQDGTFTFSVLEKYIMVTLTSRKYSFLRFRAHVFSTGEILYLDIGKPVTVGLGKAAIQRE